MIIAKSAQMDCRRCEVKLFDRTNQRVFNPMKTAKQKLSARSLCHFSSSRPQQTHAVSPSSREEDKFFISPIFSARREIASLENFLLLKMSYGGRWRRVIISFDPQRNWQQSLILDCAAEWNCVSASRSHTHDVVERDDERVKTRAANWQSPSTEKWWRSQGWAMCVLCGPCSCALFALSRRTFRRITIICSGDGKKRYISGYHAHVFEVVHASFVFFTSTKIRLTWPDTFCYFIANIVSNHSYKTKLRLQ